MSKPLQKIMQESIDSLVLIDYVDNSLSAREVLGKLGYTGKGQYVTLLKSFLDTYSIDYTHWTSNGKERVTPVKKNCVVCKGIFTILGSIGKDQVTCSRACSNTHFRSGNNNPNWVDGNKTYRDRAIRTFGCKCQRCGYDANEAAIVVHHKDHSRENNDISNLEVLCANCHAIHHCS
jgi:hypothetical protein